MYQTKQFDERCKDILELMISEATMAFEILPIIENAEIIRNILYSGVWTKYELIKKNEWKVGNNEPISNIRNRSKCK